MWQDLDKQATLFLNSLHHASIDKVMILISNKPTWYSLYALLIGLVIYTSRKRSWLVLVNIALLITLADRISSGLIKPLVMRLRPCHEALMYPFLHLPDGCGGSYGFVSSHAANTFAIACFLFLYFNKQKWTYLLFLWAAVVSYSRIYLGAHYLGDVMCGALLGGGLGWLVYRSYLVFYQKIFQTSHLFNSK
jgi:undecaprenyl-diphosphatase